jgi:hypothetical protein
LLKFTFRNEIRESIGESSPEETTQSYPDESPVATGSSPIVPRGSPISTSPSGSPISIGPKKKAKSYRDKSISPLKYETGKVRAKTAKEEKS